MGRIHQATPVGREEVTSSPGACSEAILVGADNPHRGCHSPEGNQTDYGDHFKPCPRGRQTLIRIVGTPEPTSSCLCCLARRGLFVHCIRDTATPRCGNCHWLGTTCSLSPEESEGTPRRRLRRPTAKEITVILEEMEGIKEQYAKLQERHVQLLQQVKEINYGLAGIMDGNLRTQIALRSGDTNLVQQCEDAEGVDVARLRGISFDISA